MAETRNVVSPGGRTGHRRPGLGWGIAGILGGLGLVLALMVGGMVVIPRYRAEHPASPLQRSDADRAPLDDLYLDLTLVTPAFRDSRNLERYLGDRDPESVLPLLAGLNTHRGSIEHMHHLQGELVLVGPDGSRYPALTEPIVLSQHHNAYMFLFPARGNHGERFLDLEDGVLSVEALGVGVTPIRRFTWDLPIADQAGFSLFGGGVTAGLALLLALVGALLVVLSPCALELSLYYSAIISTTVTEGERDAAAAGSGAAGRQRVVRNLLAFLGGFTLLYALSGATVGLVGQGVRRPLAAYGGLIQLVSGGIILIFALKVLGAGRLLFPAGRSAASGGAGILALPGRFLARLRRGVQERAHERGAMRARDSFLVGVGLSSACLTCMGGAVLYPLLVYIGITSWFWGLMTLGLYSVGIAVPMMLIALGFFRVRLTLTRRLGFNRTLRMVSGVLLAGIGLLLLTGNERIVTDVSYGLLAEVSRWFA